MKLKAKDTAKQNQGSPSPGCGVAPRHNVERRKGVFRAGTGVATIADQRLKTLRSSERFRLWLRVVLPPDELQRFERWALDDEGGFALFVKRYSDISSGRSECEHGQEKLVDDIYETLLEIEDLSFDDSFEDWANSREDGYQEAERQEGGRQREALKK